MTVHGVVSTYLIQIDYGNATGGPKFPKQISREKESLSHYGIPGCGVFKGGIQN